MRRAVWIERWAVAGSLALAALPVIAQPALPHKAGRAATTRRADRRGTLLDQATYCPISQRTVRSSSARSDQVLRRSSRSTASAASTSE